MTTDLAPRIVNPRTGELVGLEVGGAISVDEAAEQLPLVTAAIAHLIRVKDYLRDVITDSMVKAGQTERLMGEALYELKGDASWIVDDQGALFRALVDACSHDQITRLELDDAVQQVVEFVFHQGKLNALARRVPAVDQLRRRVEGEPRLRQKR